MKNHIKHLIFLLQCLVLALFFFGLSRLIFFGFTSDLFPQIYEDGFWQVFAHGLRFDLSAFAYFNLIFILLIVLPTRQREKKAYQKISMFYVILYLCNRLRKKKADFKSMSATLSISCCNFLWTDKI